MAIEFLWLQGDEARAIDPHGLEWPSDAHILFVYEDGVIVGRSSMTILPILNLSMVEGTWVRDDKHGTTLAARMVKEVERHFVEHGKTHAFAFTLDSQPEIGDYLARFGWERKPLSVYMKQLVSDVAEKAA